MCRAVKGRQPPSRGLGFEHRTWGLAEEWRGASQFDWLSRPTCLLKPSCCSALPSPRRRANLHASQGRKTRLCACSAPLATGERRIGRCYNPFPSEFLELMSVSECLGFTSQGDWSWELPHYIRVLSHTYVHPPPTEETFVVSIWRGPAGGQHLML